VPQADGHRLIVPLVQKNLVAGYIEIVGGGPGGFAADEVELVQLLANQAAASVDNARLYETIERQATTDGLTGLYNHRHFFERLGAEVTRAQRYGFALSVMMLDLDDFKSFNDRFGHPAGDRVLSTVGDILRGQLREDVDVAARYGGEEFSVILPHMPPAAESDAIRSSGERVRQSIAAADLPLREIDRPAHITASVGVATLPAHAVAADELVSMADEALYAAKQRGKNRVEVYARG
jgi:diguanylate cyclase (GGDEF)-like protein